MPAAGLELDPARQLDQVLRRHHALLGIRPGRSAAERYPIAGLDVADAGADLLHHAGAFLADAGRQGQRVETRCGDRRR